MKIVACLKRVPTTETQPKIAAGGTALDAAGVQYMVSFYDEIAVEQAIRLKEQHGGEAILLTVGPADAQKELRDGLARGADSGVIAIDDQWSQRDAWSTANAIADQVKRIGADLVLTGRVATDRDNAAVGPMVATLLGWACVTDVIELTFDGQKGRAKREADAGVETFEFTLPAVVTCQKGLAEPRYAALKGIMAAKKKPIEEVPAAAVANQAKVASLELPAPRKEGRIVGEGPAAVGPLLTALREEARAL